MYPKIGRKFWFHLSYFSRYISLLLYKVIAKGASRCQWIADDYASAKGEKVKVGTLEDHD